MKCLPPLRTSNLCERMVPNESGRPPIVRVERSVKGATPLINENNTTSATVAAPKSIECFIFSFMLVPLLDGPGRVRDFGNAPHPPIHTLVPYVPLANALKHRPGGTLHSLSAQCSQLTQCTVNAGCRFRLCYSADPASPF